MLGASVVGGIYLWIQVGFHDSEGFKGLVMALAYAWGLILAIYLMGHGLVALPRRLLRTANISRRLRTLQSHAPKVHDRLLDAIDRLDEYESQVMQLRQRKSGTARDFEEWIEELAEAASLPESRRSTGATNNKSTVPNVITERYLADLTRKLKRARHKKMRFVDEWDRLVTSAVANKAILDSAATKRLEFPPQQSQTIWSRYNTLTPYTRYVLHYHILPTVYYTLSFLFSLASICIVWSSIVKSQNAKLSLIGWSVVHHPGSNRGQIGPAGQLIAAGWILYMCACALFSITEVKVWGNRALVRRGTYLESACWYSLQVAKLTVPLAYNFITFLPHNIYSETTFHKFLGRLIVLSNIGEGFQDWFPALILVPVLMALFGVYGKVKSCFSFGAVMDDEEEVEGSVSSWREGRALIEQEVNARGTGLASGSISVGLTARDEATGSYRDEPPFTGDSAGAGPSSHAQRSRPARSGREGRSLLSGIDDDDLDDTRSAGFFDDFAQRVRNTFDTADFSFERPAWLGGPGGGADQPRRGYGYRPVHGAGNQERNDQGNSFLSLFGGGRSEGRVRL